MDLAFNAEPHFTKWLAASGALHESFVVIDIGVQGGENPRWHFLGEHLVVHGFYAIAESVADLSKAASLNRRYHWCAIGNEDGEREFFYKRDDPTNSSFHVARGPDHESRTVPVRRLDTLFAQGTIPQADFIKVDVEGFEREVFWGADALLSAGVLGVETETNFNSSPLYPDTHFALIQGLLHNRGLVVFDLNFNRVRCAAYQEALRRRSHPLLPIERGGRIATVNVLFCRSLPAGRDGSLYFERQLAPLSVDQILKAMVIYELYGLNDIAVDTAVKYSDELGRRIDVERAVDLLCQTTDQVQVQEAPTAPPTTPAAFPDPSHRELALAESRIMDLQREGTALKEQIKAIQTSTSWRITAPLRSIVDRVRQTMSYVPTSSPTDAPALRETRSTHEVHHEIVDLSRAGEHANAGRWDEAAERSKPTSQQTAAAADAPPRETRSTHEVHHEIVDLLGRAGEHADAGRWEEAIAETLKAAQVAEDHDNPAVILDVARALQRLHLFKRAWEIFRNANCKSWMTRAQEWDGRKIADGVLVIRAVGQPSGDFTRYGRLLQHAAQRSTRCIALTDPRFVPLFKRSFPDVDVRAEGPDTEDALAEAGAIASFETLCSYFASDWAAIQQTYVPLRPDPALASALRQQYRRGHSRPVVGLSWYSVNSQKDVPALEEWSDFIASFPATFVCLQYGDVASDVEHLRQAADGRLIFDSSLDQLVDIDAFAAQVAAMDAIVTIPNTTAHMGGAVGVPTIVVLDDRFHLSWPKLKAETPWYPSVTMIRRRGRNWQPVLDEVRDQLQSLVHEAMKRAPPSPTRP